MAGLQADRGEGKVIMLAQQTGARPLVPIDTADVTREIRNMSRKKAVGADGTRAEELQALPRALRRFETEGWPSMAKQQIAVFLAETEHAHKHAPACALKTVEGHDGPVQFTDHVSNYGQCYVVHDHPRLAQQSALCGSVNECAVHCDERKEADEEKYK
eukprot:1214460-Amphidinium_carterae.1